jgi:hypothetical protein
MSEEVTFEVWGKYPEGPRKKSGEDHTDVGSAMQQRDLLNEFASPDHGAETYWIVQATTVRKVITD